MSVGEIRNPLRTLRKRPMRLPKVDELVLRLRDARTRMRLGLPQLEELDALLDSAAEELETAAEIASTVQAHERRYWGEGELVWVPKACAAEVWDIIEEDDEEDCG